jgi:4-hydroxyacetophenone monooxygenase
VGGTWFENTYPGCRVDVANHFYCFSFEPNHEWSEFFCQRAELQDYFERCADRYGVREHIRFDTEVVSARYDERTAQWSVTLRAKHGPEEEITAHALISAVGQLNRPKIPELPGLDGFRRAAFHSAAWDHDVRLSGRRVAVIGSGASALQLVPEVAKEAAHLCVFQRSPAWMVPNPNYHSAVSEGKKWLLAHVPFYARWYRFLLFWPGSDGLMPSLEVDPSWPHPERSVNALNEQMRILFTSYMQQQVQDPELLEKVVPRYPPFIKRMLQDNGSWLQALQRENVELVTDPIAEIAPDAIVCRDGTRHPVDAIVFATGFHASRFLWPMQITGRGGVELGRLWGEDPKAYLGVTVPGFPNLFCLYGPGTNLAHAGSIIFHSECQVRYVMGCLEALLERGQRAMECKPKVCDGFQQRLEERLAQLVWSHPGSGSWYKNSEGRVVTTSPWRLVDYWRWTREPDLADYDLS